MNEEGFGTVAFLDVAIGNTWLKIKNSVGVEAKGLEDTVNLGILSWRLAVDLEQRIMCPLTLSNSLDSFARTASISASDGSPLLAMIVSRRTC